MAINLLKRKVDVSHSCGACAKFRQLNAFARIFIQVVCSRVGRLYFLFCLVTGVSMPMVVRLVIVWVKGL